MTYNASLRALLKEENIAEDRATILIVDDDTLIRQTLEMTLQQQGYHVVAAENGESAIDLLKKISPALIICDQYMPGMNGIEVMQKAQELRPNTIRILLTASHDVETAMNAINIGRVDHYLTKPLTNQYLLKTVKNALERYRLIKENQILQTLIFHQHKKLTKAHESLHFQFQLGASVHKELLVGKIPNDIPYVSMSALSIPSHEIDGDFFEFYRPNEQILDLVLGDVMGKGVAAALVGTAVKTQMQRFSLPSVKTRLYERRSGWVNPILEPEHILDNVNREIGKKLIDLEYFVSLFYGRFDFQYRTFSYLDLGSAKPLHFRAKDKTIALLEGDNFPLGVKVNSHFQTKQILFAPGDIFLFYSDGVSEARSENHALFGTKEMAELLKIHSHLSPQELINTIRQSVFRFTGKEKQDDDLTLIAIKIENHKSKKPHPSSHREFFCDLSELGSIRDFVHSLCLQAPGDAARLSKEMQLVISEVFCNIFKHGKTDIEKKKVIIHITLQQEGVLFDIKDQGLPYDPQEIVHPSFSAHQQRGFGWYIIKELVDRLSYQRKVTVDEWNHLSLFKHYYIGDKKMKIDHKKQGTVLVITPDFKSLDANHALQFKEAVMDLINQNGLQGVVFDLNHIQFIDSSGLGSFLSILRFLNENGGDLKLSHMNKPIRAMFELVKMHQIFEIFNSTEEAVISFR